jgi:hypothetical protein
MISPASEFGPPPHGIDCGPRKSVIKIPASHTIMEALSITPEIIIIVAKDTTCPEGRRLVGSRKLTMCIPSANRKRTAASAKKKIFARFTFGFYLSVEQYNLWCGLRFLIDLDLLLRGIECLTAQRDYRKTLGSINVQKNLLQQAEDWTQRQ